MPLPRFGRLPTLFGGGACGAAWGCTLCAQSGCETRPGARPGCLAHRLRAHTESALDFSARAQVQLPQAARSSMCRAGRAVALFLFVVAVQSDDVTQRARGKLLRGTTSEGCA